jgi:hypothetical protein
MVSTNPPSPFVIDVYRLGYYGGKGGRHMARLGPFNGKVQPEPGIGHERLRECQWEPATTLLVPDDWTSGVYVGKLTSEKNGLQSYVVFIVGMIGLVMSCFNAVMPHGQPTTGGQTSGLCTMTA